MFDAGCRFGGPNRGRAHQFLHVDPEPAGRDHVGADSLLLGELGHAQEHLDTFGAEGVRRGAGGGQAGRAAVSGVAKSSAEGPCQELKTRSHMGPIADMKMKEE